MKKAFNIKQHIIVFIKSRRRFKPNIRHTTACSEIVVHRFTKYTPNLT
jgi:ribosomal protein L28